MAVAHQHLPPKERSALRIGRRFRKLFMSFYSNLVMQQRWLKMHNSDLKVSKIRQISMSEIEKSQKNDLQKKLQQCKLPKNHTVKLMGSFVTTIYSGMKVNPFQIMSCVIWAKYFPEQLSFRSRNKQEFISVFLIR